jgi:hypothetical protein
VTLVEKELLTEAVNRRTDNTMTKQNKTKGQTIIYKHYTEDRATQSPLKRGVNSGAP